MARVGHRSGCKVGWDYYADEQEAIEAAKAAAIRRDELFKHGYDFGYQWPGSPPVFQVHPEHGEVWVVVVP